MSLFLNDLTTGHHTDIDQDSEDSDATKDSQTNLLLSLVLLSFGHVFNFVRLDSVLDIGLSYDLLFVDDFWFIFLDV